MKMLVVGAGAVGGYFGAYLTAAGRDVTFLVREARAAQLQGDGLRIVTQEDELTVRPQLVLAHELKPLYEVVLLGVKAFALAQAIEDFAPAIRAETMILPMLNGMGHIDTLTARFGDRAVLGGATHISTDVDAEGRIHRLTPRQDFVYGERVGGSSERVKRIEAFVRDAGFDDRLSENVTAYMWEKWVILSALASITCLFRASIGEVVAAQHGLALANAALDETASVAQAEGHAASAGFMDAARERLTAHGSALTASMFRNIQAGLPVEVEHILGDLLRRGDARGLALPLLRAAYVNVATYQARLEAHLTMAHRDSSATPLFMRAGPG